MALPEADLSFLEGRGLEYVLELEANLTSVIVKAWPLPPGYDRPASDLLVRLPAGYPDVQPDMWWFDPPVRLRTGASVQATDCFEMHLGRQWQRWSRHFAVGQWKSGIDGLESYLALIRSELLRCSQGAA